MGPRMGAARGRAGAWRGVAQGRTLGPPRSAVAWGCAGAQQRGAAPGRGMGP